jgi:hypothetical protein
MKHSAIIPLMQGTRIIALVQRVRFLGKATVSGWRWLVELSNHVGLAALILAFAFGVSIFGGLKLPRWWYGLLILAGFYVVLFGEGAFRVWREAASPEERSVAQTAAQSPSVLRVDLATLMHDGNEWRVQLDGVDDSGLDPIAEGLDAWWKSVEAKVREARSDLVPVLRSEAGKTNMVWAGHDQEKQRWRNWLDQRLSQLEKVMTQL